MSQKTERADPRDLLEDYIQKIWKTLEQMTLASIEHDKSRKMLNELLDRVQNDDLLMPRKRRKKTPAGDTVNHRLPTP